MDVELVNGADEALERLTPTLLLDEARHNLAFGILSTAQAHPDVYPEVRAWLVRDADRIVGAALRTPPHNLVVIEPHDRRAIDALADAIEDELPGVVAAVPEVDVFASAWTLRHGLTAAEVFDQGIYALRRLRSPRPTPGGERLAGTPDRELVLAWLKAFAAEVLHGGDDEDGARLARSVDARLASDVAGVALWEVDGVPVSLAGFGGPTPNGIRIGPVYTPPERRGNGFGSAVTAAVTRLMLDRGYGFCFLYTDLANPTSNGIYLRLGYERVCDSREIAFVAPTG